jgi:hypothetical protein
VKREELVKMMASDIEASGDCKNIDDGALG